MIFVAGKGGTGKSTVGAALALLAARAGKRVLAIDVDGKGDLAAALGSQHVGFAPHLVQQRVSVLSLDPQQSFQEYLRIYFKVPTIARLTPLRRVFDFIATAVPGPRDMLVVGKIAYEEQRRETKGRPAWDLIVVDSAASGEVISHLSAPTSMLTLVRGGVIRSQVEWIEALIRDPARATVVLCALPEEMPVVEAGELYKALRKDIGIAVDACVLNRMVVEATTPAMRTLARGLVRDDARERLTERLGGSPEPMCDAVELADRLHAQGVIQARRLRSAVPVPLVRVPLLATRPGLATARQVADAIARDAA